MFKVMCPHILTQQITPASIFTMNRPETQLRQCKRTDLRWTKRKCTQMDQCKLEVSPDQG